MSSALSSELNLVGRLLRVLQHRQTSLSSMFRASFQPAKASVPFLFRFLTNAPPSPPPISPASSASLSSVPPKFAFELGLAFAGKPRRRGEQIPQGLTGGGDKVAWRDSMLAWGAGKQRVVEGKQDAGEDFFFIRDEDPEVSRSATVLMTVISLS